MYTKKEKDTIKAICKNEEFVEIIKKVLLENKETLGNAAFSKNNEELGEIVRADHLAQEKIGMRIARFIQLGTEPKTGKGKVVPE